MMTATLSALGEAAIAYARIGWKVFPLAPGGKEPLISQRMGGQGFKDGTTDEALIRKWWSATPDANIGMWPGGSGLVVVDPDLYKPECEWSGFVTGRDIPDTLVQITPRGGQHYFFDAGGEPFHGGTLCKGVDVRFSGYVVLAPSKVDGNAYMWFGDDPSETGECPAPAPDWLPRKRPEQERPQTTSDLASDDIFSIFAAVRDIPNPDLGWEEWNRVGMAVWAATTGSPAGRVAFHEWSKLSGKYSQSETDSRWDHYFTSPPSAIGAGTLFHEAAEARRATAEWIDRLRENMDRRAGVLVPSPAGGIQILSSDEFVSDWAPGAFLLKPIIETGRLYTLTGPTGTGKTAVALLMALSVATGAWLGSSRVRHAGVLFLAGENPHDVKTRWIAMLRNAGIDPKSVNVRFVEGRFAIDQQHEIIAAHIAENPCGLVIVDTLQAFFDGDDSNSNEQMKAAAASFRRISNLGPAVLVPAHPVKSATKDRNVPYGGGAFLNEIDGNLSLWGDQDSIELHWCGKFRGSFDPLHFSLYGTTVPGVVDEDGDPVRTVVARVILPDEADANEGMVNADLQRLMVAILDNPGASVNDLANSCSPMAGASGWSKRTTYRRLQQLASGGLVLQAAGIWALTPLGKRIVDKIG